MTEDKQKKLRMRCRNTGEALAISQAIFVGHVMKAGRIEQQIECPANACAIEARDITPHEFDGHVSFISTTASDLKRALDRIDAGCLPAVLRQINRIAPHAATEINRAAWGK
jgi:hypothetical protein